MPDVSDDENDDFVPIQNKRRRFAAPQPVRKQRNTPSHASPQVPVQGALLPKNSTSSHLSHPHGHHGNLGRVRLSKLPTAIELPATARSPLRSLQAGAATPVPGAHAIGTGDLAAFAPTASCAGKVAPGMSSWKGSTRLSCTPVPPAPTSCWDSDGYGGARPATSLPTPSLTVPATAGPWRRLSESRLSRLASRRSEGPRAQGQQEKGRTPTALSPSHQSAILTAGTAPAAPAAKAANTAPEQLRLPPPPSSSAVAAEHMFTASKQSSSPSGNVTMAAATRNSTVAGAVPHCPICGCDLGQVSDTATGREAHVNACLDGGGPVAAPDALCGRPGALDKAHMRDGRGAWEDPRLQQHHSAGGVERLAGQPRWSMGQAPLGRWPCSAAGGGSVSGGCTSGGGREHLGLDVPDKVMVMEVELLDSEDEDLVEVPVVAPAGAPAAAATAAATAVTAGHSMVAAVPTVQDVTAAVTGAAVEAESCVIRAAADACTEMGPVMEEHAGGDRGVDEAGTAATGTADEEAGAGCMDQDDTAAVAEAKDDQFHLLLATQEPTSIVSMPPYCKGKHAAVDLHAGGGSGSVAGTEDNGLLEDCWGGFMEWPVPRPGCDIELSGNGRVGRAAPVCPDLHRSARNAAGYQAMKPYNGSVEEPEAYDGYSELEDEVLEPCDGSGLEQCHNEDEAAAYEGQGGEEGPQPREESDQEDDPVAVWLGHHGLQRWLPLFWDGEVDEAVVPKLNDSDLQGLGIDSPRSRAAILAAARDFGATTEPSACAVDTAAAHGQEAPAWACLTDASRSAEPHAPIAQPRHLPGLMSSGACTAARPAIYDGPPQYRPSYQQHRPQQDQEQLAAVQHSGGHVDGPCTLSVVRPLRQPAKVVPGAALGLAAGSAQPFSSMFLAKTAGPVRITSFFPGPTAARASSPADIASTATVAVEGGATVTSTGSGEQPHALSWGRDAQLRPHSATVPYGGQTAAWRQPLQQQSVSRRLPPLPQRPQSGTGQAGSAGGSRGGCRLDRLPRWVPECHTIPGTRMLVDFFGPPSKGIPASMSPFRILTHFHADHYKGLTRSFTGGTVLASPVTARLVSERLKLPAARVQVLPMDTAVEVDGVSLTLVDANHCPGAAMVVAQPSGGWPPVLHTGDCRLGEHMRSHPALQALVGRRCTLVLDTTYCDPQYEFPPQKAVLDAVMEAVKAESFNKRALFVFGTYTIGKERLFLEVAAALGQKVYCSKEKAATLAACGLAPRYASLITTNHLEASIHAVPLFKVTLDGLSAILQQYRGRYSAVIGFSPTGWNYTGGPRGGSGGSVGGASGCSGGRSSGGRGGRGGRGRGGPSVLSRQQQSAVISRRMARGTAVVYQVPYSEHSSFCELRAFVSWLQPGRIVPSVNADGPAGPKTRRMLQLLLGPENVPAGTAAGRAGGAASSAPAARRDIRSFMKGMSAASGDAGGGSEAVGAAAEPPAVVTVPGSVSAG